MKTVIVLVDRHPRSKRLSEALASGVTKVGWQAIVTDEQHNEPRGDLCAAYGWLPNRDTMKAYRQAGSQFLHVDLGYWDRKRREGDYGGHHKVILNSRHPTEYFRQKHRPSTRILGSPDVLPWRRNGDQIVIAGLSAKGAISIGRNPLAWENDIIGRLKKITNRPIVYRPKPSWRDARPIHGTIFSPPQDTIHDALIGAHALVTMYSNAAIDALASGIPVFAEDGVAKVMSMPALEDIDDPPEWSVRERRQFLADVGFCHWTKAEIADGTMLRQFLDDGLIAA